MDKEDLKSEILKDPILFNLSGLAKKKNAQIFLVGGYIRDLFLGMHRRDYDLTLPKEAYSFISTMEEFLHLHFFKIGKEETNTITYRMIKKDFSIDLTLFHGKAVEEDLLRRDFTVNATAFSLLDGTFHSVKKAMKDMKNRVIRSVSMHSIDRDPLRMLRAIRYLCTLDGFTIDIALKKEISLKKEKIDKLSGERIKMELNQILLSPRPEIGIKSLYELGILFILMPELKNLENLGQNEHHHLHVLFHTFLTIEKISWTVKWFVQRGMNIDISPEDWLSIYYAALFHDIGKQDTYSIDEKAKVHFYHHEAFSCQKADNIMKRLRFSNMMRNKILRLVQHHMRILNLSQETKKAALKRLVNQMVEETPLLVVLTLADKEASREILSVQIDEVVEGHCLQILELFKEKDIVHPPPLISGRDVMGLGYTPGPKVGQILNFIRDKQVEGDIKSREQALEILRERFALSRKR